MTNKDRYKFDDILLKFAGVNELLACAASFEMVNSNALYVLSNALYDAIEELREVVGEE